MITARACIALRELTDRRSLTILREIIAAIRQFGFPKQIRVDNDPSLKSRVMRSALRVLSVKLQVVDIACPWQNGRVERFFGAFKAAMARIIVNNASSPPSTTTIQKLAAASDRAKPARLEYVFRARKNEQSQLCGLASSNFFALALDLRLIGGGSGQKIARFGQWRRLETLGIGQ
ncbi:MAG: DDE-type integrase/transposase/recombinase [Xanthomonadales bacterium]|nr:DDE-type integrase/transposase/recombinase [Xanthomonadales bacterium]